MTVALAAKLLLDPTQPLRVLLGTESLFLGEPTALPFPVAGKVSPMPDEAETIS